MNFRTTAGTLSLNMMTRHTRSCSPGPLPLCRSSSVFELIQNFDTIKISGPLTLLIPVAPPPSGATQRSQPIGTLFTNPPGPRPSYAANVVSRIIFGMRLHQSGFSGFHEASFDKIPIATNQKYQTCEPG